MVELRPRSEKLPDRDDRAKKVPGRDGWQRPSSPHHSEPAFPTLIPPETQAESPIFPKRRPPPHLLEQVPKCHSGA